MSEIKISPSTLLRYAKTKMIMRDTANVKNAKKFSDLTPAKQKIVREAYFKRLNAKKAPEHMASGATDFRGGVYKLIKPEGVPLKFVEEATKVVEGNKAMFENLRLGYWETNIYNRVPVEGYLKLGPKHKRYVEHLEEYIGKYRDKIEWGKKNGITNKPKQLNPKSNISERKKQLEKLITTPIGKTGLAGVKMTEFLKESYEKELKNLNTMIAGDLKESTTIKTLEQLQDLMDRINKEINKRSKEANKKIQAREKENAKSIAIASKGLIGGIGVVKEPKKIDTSKASLNMGKEVSITEGKKFREEFKGGAKITWLDHVKQFRAANPEISYKDALKQAGETYKPMRKKEREQQKVDTAEKKKSFVPKPRKLSKKQVALRFKSYSESLYDDFNGYKPDFEKVWDEHIKGKRFKDNEELLKVFKEKFEGVEVERKKASLLAEKEKEEADRKKTIEFRIKIFKEDYEGKIPSKFKYVVLKSAKAVQEDRGFNIYDRILKYYKFKSGEKGYVEYLKAQRDYALLPEDLEEKEKKKIKNKWTKLINEEKRKRRKIKEAKGK